MRRVSFAGHCVDVWPFALKLLAALRINAARKWDARRNIMSDTYIIEVSSEAAGIVVREKSGFRFFAAVHASACKRFGTVRGTAGRGVR